MVEEDLSNADASFVREEGDEHEDELRAINTLARVGDVNRDGYDDFIIGSSFNSEYRGSSGQTYLILGKSSGWEMDTSLAGADASFVGESGGDRSACSLSGAGDVNGDGYDDFIIGSEEGSDDDGEEGMTYVILGKADGWAMDSYLGYADASFLGEHGDDNAGYSIAMVRDVNGDGYDEILIGAQSNNESGNSAGQTYLVFSDYVHTSGAYRRVLPAGDVTAEDFGTTRTVIDFNAGTAGLTDVTLYRTAPDGDFSDGEASVYWEISTVKTGFSADVTFHYLDGEIAGLDEADLELYTRESGAASWEVVPNQTLNTSNNTIHITGLDSFSQFTLSAIPPVVPPPVGGLSVSLADDASDGSAPEQSLPWTWLGVIALVVIGSAPYLWRRINTRQRR